jgi:cellulose synthase/poly-beta-1,6-N-acetylglucosamine synthase-like glycosyltransferase
MVRLSVVIPARNAAATLGTCLRALASEGVPGDDAELLVVDDASSDATRELAADWGARVLHSHARGPAAARNAGARAARGQLLVFLDADTTPRAGWLHALTAPLQDAGVTAVKGRYHTRQRATVAQFSQVEFEEKYARLERARCVDFVDTGTMAIRRDALLAVGGFDEQLACAEDVDLAYRLASRGARFVFAPEAGVDHQHADRLPKYLLKKARFGYFRSKVYRRFPRKALGDSYTPPLMGLQIAMAGVIGILTMLAILGVPTAWLVLMLSLGVFSLTTLPLIRRAHDRDGWRLAAVVPPLCFARAFAQGLGVLLAVLSEVRPSWRRVPGHKSVAGPSRTPVDVSPLR